jgi:hypothetical protein
MLKWISRCGVLISIFLLTVPLFSQNCALCYTQAAASGGRFVSALRDGILVLMVPPVFMSVGITWLAYRKRNKFRQDIDTENEFDEDREFFDE